MLQVLSDHFFCDVARAPHSVPDGPEMSPPVLLPKLRELFLESARASALQPLDQVTDGLRRRILYEHVDVVFADHTLKYANIFSISDLNDQLTTPLLDIALEHVVAVLGDPDQVCREPGNCMTAVSLFSHLGREF